MNLYDLKTELIPIQEKLELWAFDHDGDITDFPLLDTLENLELNMEEKALGVGVWIKNLLAEAEALKAEKQRIEARQKACNNKADRLKKFLADMIPTSTKYKSTQCVIGWRRSEVVEVHAPAEDLPIEFQTIKIEANKADIKRSLKAGKELEFAELVTKQNIQIK